MADRTLTVVPTAAPEYNHFFGGPLTTCGFPRESLPVSLHMLYSFDMRDPNLGFLKLADVDRLPIVFPLRYDGADVGYRVLPGDNVEFFPTRELKYVDDWPYENYPPHFDATAVAVVPLAYEEYRALVFRYAMSWAGWLREDDRAILEALNDPITQLGGIQELPFGPVEAPCPNPQCDWHDRHGALMEILTIWNEPLPGLHLWGADQDVLIVYALCAACGSIYATNMCG